MIAAIPVDLQRVFLSIERAGVLVSVGSHHHNVPSEVDVAVKAGVEIGHALFVDEFTEQLPLVGVLDEHRAVAVPAYHIESLREGGRLVVIVLRLFDGDGHLASLTATPKPAVKFDDIGIAAGNADSPIVRIVISVTARVMVEQLEYAVIIAAGNQVDLIFLTEGYLVAHHVDSSATLRFGICAIGKVSDGEDSLSGAHNM
ncbi:hypothetical protein [Prevotella intermedia]|uniref:hypothetical protein n=1 Tax=Prevotella intermedia TaxID=28131 RepID=UPI001E453531|nr:hypothetical protein [Prevotella intermedia]